MAGAKARVFGGKVALALVALVALFGLPACEATFTPQPVTLAYARTVVPAQVVPYDIYAYPHVYFGDTWVYLVDGTWYFPTDEGWMMYREEPRELGRYRTQMQRSPGYYEPPTYQSPDYGYPPPVQRGNPFPHETGRQRTPR